MGRLDTRDDHGWGCSRPSRRGRSHRKGWRRGPTVKVRGGGRECGSRDRRWREVGEAAYVRCEEAMAIPHRMGVRLLGQQE